MRQSYLEHIGTISDHLRWFEANFALSKINTETFNRAAETSNLSKTALAEALKISRPKLYKPSTLVDKQIRERLIDLVMISDLAFHLHEKDKDKTVVWIMSPNHLFFGRSPFEKALAGEGKRVLEKLEEMIA